jgi:hypothetical protein
MNRPCVLQAITPSEQHTAAGKSVDCCSASVVFACRLILIFLIVLNIIPKDWNLGKIRGTTCKYVVPFAGGAAIAADDCVGANAPIFTLSTI